MLVHFYFRYKGTKSVAFSFVLYYIANMHFFVFLIFNDVSQIFIKYISSKYVLLMVSFPFNLALWQTSCTVSHVGFLFLQFKVRDNTPDVIGLELGCC